MQNELQTHTYQHTNKESILC